MYTNEIDIFFKEVDSSLHLGRLLVQEQKLSPIEKFKNWLFKEEIQELEQQLDVFIKKHKKGCLLSALEKTPINIHNTDRGKNVFRMLLLHLGCKDNYISRNVCKEAFRRKKLIDSTLIWTNKKSIKSIEERLFSIHEDYNRKIYANVIASELDAKLCISFEIITDLEKLGCESLYIRRDINDYIRDLVSTFDDFNIDIINYLQQYKDFDPEFGCYETYRVDKGESKDRKREKGGEIDKELISYFYNNKFKFRKLKRIIHMRA